jgi:hypothetical protein
MQFDLRWTNKKFMAARTLGTVMIILVCILMFPIAIGILGGVFGIVMGVFGVVFGAFFGLIGGLFGAILGFLGWMFDSIFGWNHHFHFFNFNICSVLLITVVVLLLAHNRKSQK